jgi:hypothetical protein
LIFPFQASLSLLLNDESNSVAMNAGGTYETGSFHAETPAPT